MPISITNRERDRTPLHQNKGGYTERRELTPDNGASCADTTPIKSENFNSKRSKRRRRSRVSHNKRKKSMFTGSVSSSDSPIKSCISNNF